MYIEKLFSDLLLEESLALTKNLTVQDYVLGLSYVAVKTQSGVGLAYTFRNQISSGCNVLSEDLRKRPASEIAHLINSYDIIESAIGLATVNSVLKDYNTETDIYDNIDFRNKNVGMVGYFRPVIKQLSPIVKNLYIFELKDIEGTYDPAYAKRKFPECDIVIISGTTLVNKTTEDFFCYIPNHCKTVILGPSTPMSENLSEYADLYGFKINREEGAMDAIEKGAGMKILKKFGTKIAKISSRR